jgi:hypothetical protein
MFFVQSGVNIMRPTNLILLGAMVIMAALSGCGTSTTDQPAATKTLSDRDLMQASLTEVISRWHMGDRGGLYDNEFPYIRERYTFDDYLKFKELQLDADTVKAMNVLDAKLLGQDSADVTVEVVFEGPTGKISRRQDHYIMFRWKDKWIRPTVSIFQIQAEWDQRRHEADSAAEAEAKELEGK